MMEMLKMEMFHFGVKFPRGIMRDKTSILAFFSKSPITGILKIKYSKVKLSSRYLRLIRKYDFLKAIAPLD